MNLSKLFLSKTTVTALVAIAGLIAFNAFNSKLETEQLASFNEWYPTTSALLASDKTEDLNRSKLRVSIRLEGGLQKSEWNFPSHSLSDAEDRDKTSRVLQLISESKIFGITPASKSSSGETISIAVSDDTVSFATTVKADAVKENIQLQNLLKLLEIYAKTPTQQVNPAQL